MKNLVLETPRLTLREMDRDDIDFLADLLAHPEVMRFWPRCYSREEASEWIRRQQDRYASHGYGYWLAVEKETSRPVGEAGLLPQEVDGVEVTGLGYILHRPFWGRGFATEAASACLAHGFGHFGKRRVIALIRPENQPSRAVAARLGMMPEKNTTYSGFEHIIFTKLRDDLPAGA